jgi:hypothetical protein
MQENRLFINGIEMQLSDRTRIGVTLQANNLGELQNRQGTFTNTFRIPLNAYNREKLEHANIMTSTTSLPYQKLRIDYYEGAFNIMPNAEGVISNSDKDWIYIDASGGNVNLKRSIGDTTIGELFQGQTHVWNFDNVVDSRDGSRVYIYPFIDWRTDEDTTFDTPTVDPSKLLPCLREQAIFEELETLTGYTFTGSYISSAEHRNGALTPSDLNFNPEYFDEIAVKSTHLDTGLTPTSFEVLESSGFQMFNSPLNLLNDETGFINGVYYPAVNEVGNLRVTTNLFLYVSYFFSQSPANQQTKEYWIVAQIKENGTVIAEKTYPHIFVQASPAYAEQFVIDLQTGDIPLLSGNQYFVNFEIYANAHTNADTTVYYTVGALGDPGLVKFEKSPVNQIIYGSEIRYTDLFRMKANDVVKDLLNMRGIIIQTNAYSNEVSFNFFDDLIENKPNALDWSSLIDVRQTDLYYKFGSYGQRNNFKFTENDQVTEGLGNWYFDIADATLDAEVDAVQLNHSATEQAPKYQGAIIPEIEGITTDLNVWGAPGWRILQMETSPTSYNTTYNDGTDSEIVTTNVPFCRFIGFDYLVPNYYEALQGILSSAKSLQLIVKLSPDLIHNIDFTIPIVLNVPELDISGYFYINVVNRYQGGNTLVEFVRL